MTPKDSISKSLGFKKDTLAANESRTPSTPVRILKFNSLRVECNITLGAYINDQKPHTIHEFFPAVPPGFKIIEIPSKVIYQPITIKNINYLQLKIVEENDNLVNFRGETITVR